MLPGLVLPLYLAVVAPVFGPVLAALGATSVPVLLPSSIPESSEGKLFASAHVSKHRYDVEIALAPDCGGAGACRLGDVAGSTTREQRGGRAVKLRDGTPAYFIESTCGASCGDGTLSWRRGKYWYTVGIKAGSLHDVEAWANAMVRPR